MPWVAALIPVVAGIAQSVAANKKQKDIEGQIKPYQTAEATKAAANFSQNLAQGGLSPEALNYLTQNIERSSSNALNAVSRAGGTPNDIGNVLDQELQAYMKVGAQDSMQQFQNFDRYLNSLGVLGQNADAEWADERNRQKDQLQQAAVDKQQGFQNIMSGVNTGLGLYAQNQQINLYKEDMANKNAQFAQMFGSSQLPSVRQQQYGMVGPQQEAPAQSTYQAPYLLQPRNYQTNETDQFLNRWNNYRIN